MVMKMKLIKITPRGYCKGVINAINIVKKTVIDYPNEEIHLLGNIIHNGFVKKAIENLDVCVHDTFGKNRLELLDEISSGIVIFSAHGVSDDVRNKARMKNLTIIDASCVDVLKTQDILKHYLSENYSIFYIGKKNHPEAEAMISIDPQNIFLISSPLDIPSTISKPSVITCQTTMSLYEVHSLVEMITMKYPQTIFMDEICNATRMRQEAIMNLNASEIDLLIIVGDKRSNNTLSLKKIGENCGFKKVVLIESLMELETDILDPEYTVAITAGASTPLYILTMVIDYLTSYPQNKKETIDYTKVL